MLVQQDRRLLGHRQVRHVAVQRLDVKRVTPKDSTRQHVVEMSLDRASIGVNLDPEDVSELLRA